MSQDYFNINKHDLRKLLDKIHSSFFKKYPFFNCSYIETVNDFTSIIVIGINYQENYDKMKSAMDAIFIDYTKASPKTKFPYKIEIIGDIIAC